MLKNSQQYVEKLPRKSSRQLHSHSAPLWSWSQQPPQYKGQVSALSLISCINCSDSCVYLDPIVTEMVLAHALRHNVRIIIKQTGSQRIVMSLPVVRIPTCTSCGCNGISSLSSSASTSVSLLPSQSPSSSMLSQPSASERQKGSRAYTCFHTYIQTYTYTHIHTHCT